MVKTVFHYSPRLMREFPPHPDPPPIPIPDYDPREEAPKWDWRRIMNHLPVEPKHPDLPKSRGQVAESPDKPDWRGVIESNIIPMQEPEEYKFHTPTTPRYFFFDTPDYADPFKKLWSAFEWSMKTGLLIGSFRGILEGKNLGIRDLRGLFVRYTVPWVAGCMVASTAVITIANLRGKKDDLWNYTGAGFVAAAFTGRAHYLVHFRHTILWIALATGVKYNAEINGNLTMRINPRSRNWGASGMSSEHGILSGNLHWLKAHPQGDPGRDTKGLRYG